MSRTRLEQIIRNRIALEGPITFETFMELALYHPDGGHYMTGAIPIGPRADYYTASHLHPIRLAAGEAVGRSQADHGGILRSSPSAKSARVKDTWPRESLTTS